MIKLILKIVFKYDKEKENENLEKQIKSIKEMF